MALKYIGDGSRYIGGVPAEDLNDEMIKRLATEWGYSIAETEGILIKSGLYKMLVKEAHEDAPLKKGKTS